MPIKLKINKETGIEDTQTIISDIGELYNKFINPIERLRSLSKPAPQSAYTRVPRDNRSVHEFVTQSNFTGIEINPNRPLESRANAFYRMLGLPVMSSDGLFYNPGFEPNSNVNIEKKEKINTALLSDQNLQTILFLRESSPQKRRSVFVSQNLDSTAYALVLRYVRSFSEFFNKDVGPLEKDNQIYTVLDRKNELANFAGNSSTFEQQNHILRPFITNPIVADVVMPAENMICVPFLPNRESTKIDINKALLRPGIEFILRMRLQQDSSNKDFLTEIKRIISNSSTDDSETAQDIRNTISAITGTGLTTLENNSAVNSIISQITSTQLNTLNMLVKTIKVVMEQLDDSIRLFDEIKIQLTYEPIPNIEGPEFGSSIRTVGGGTSLSEFEQKIGLLKILDLNAQQQQKITNDKLGGGSELFAGSIVSVTQKNYADEISRLTQERNNLGNQASECLSVIEKISGEVSGLGLIDVLAIYTALWSINIENLIGLLDDDSFNRLYTYNPELRTTEVESRKNGNKINGLDILSELETKIFNILSFADNIFEKARSSPNEFEGGNI